MTALVHPTPLAISAKIMDAICEYDRKALKEGRTPFPLEAHSIIRRAIQSASEEFDNARLAQND